MSDTALGDRMKAYESQYTSHRLMPLVPLCARMDGKAFHTFTRGLERPFDAGFSALMAETTRHLVAETNARCGYTQSDEISLVWYEEDPDTMFPFGGKLLKMTSVLASMTTSYFGRRLAEYLPAKADRLPLFDARVWSLPNLTEAVNYLHWRERDATRNSILMAAHTVYSPAQMHKKNTSELQDMMHAKGINWQNYPSAFKRGTFVQRRAVERPFTAEELDKLPPKHEARANPGLVIRRQDVVMLELPPLSKVTNRREVLFAGAEPVMREVVKLP